MDITHQHILSHFQVSLDEAQDKILQYGAEVLKDFVLVGQALFSGEISSANKVIANEETLLEKGKIIELLSRRILAQFHPLAVDLRHVLAVSRCSERLQSTVKEVRSIAKGVKVLIEHNHRQDLSTFMPLFKMAENELRDAMDSIKFASCDLASAVRKQDKELDALHRDLLKTLIDRMAMREHSVVTGLEILFIVRAVERVGDHAKAIAAFSLFVQSAEDVRHQKLD